MIKKLSFTDDTAVRWVCSPEGELGCGKVLTLGKDLPSPGAQYNYMEATCSGCGAKYEVWHDMEAGEQGGTLIEGGGK